MTPIQSDSRPVLAPGVRLQLDKATGEPVLLYPEGVLELNGTAHAILNLCSGAMTVADDGVKVDGDIPFAAVMFKGKIEQGFRDMVDKALA